jgi:hypothetical protein
MTTVGNILLGFAAAVIALGAIQIAGARCAKYRITDDSIEFVAFGTFRVWRCSFEDISDIRLVSFARSFLTPALHLTNRFFWAKRSSAKAARLVSKGDLDAGSARGIRQDRPREDQSGAIAG